jgi:hypothetical protein
MLPVSPRLGEACTLEMIQRIPALLKELAAGTTKASSSEQAQVVEKVVKLFERALFLAGHFDKGELFRQLFQLFTDYICSLKGTEFLKAVRDTVGESLYSLRRLRLQGHIEDFLKRLSEHLYQGRTLERLKADGKADWIDTLTLLVHLAEGWLMTGELTQSRHYLAEARETLFLREGGKATTGIFPDRLARLVCAYISAVAQSESIEEVFDRCDTLFERLEKLPNRFTSAAHYSRLHLEVIEALIRALLSDNVTLGREALRWKDDDEYLVRRRIHNDLRYLLREHGVK